MTARGEQNRPSTERCIPNIINTKYVEFTILPLEGTARCNRRDTGLKRVTVEVLNGVTVSMFRCTLRKLNYCVSPTKTALLKYM